MIIGGYGMDKNKVSKLYEDAWQFMKSKNRTELNLDDKPYINLISVLYDNVKDNPLLCEDIILGCTDSD